MADQADSKIEPFLLLAKSAKGAAAAKIISDATSANGVYTFAELLKLPNITELSKDPTHSKQFNLLQLFEYGTIATYSQSPDSYPPLNPSQIAKLKHLTLVSLASQNRALPYSVLLPALNVPDERSLEDLIIDTIYAGLLRGKMHHHEKVLHVDWVSGRSPSKDDLVVIKQRLENWCNNAQTLLDALDSEIQSLTYKTHVDAQRTAEYATERDKRFIEAFKEFQKPPAGDSKFFKSSAHSQGPPWSQDGDFQMDGGRGTRRGGKKGGGADVAFVGKEGGRIDKNGRSGESLSPRRSKRTRE